MAEVDFQTFMPKVLPYVFGCNELVAYDAIRDACREFCIRSMFLRQMLDDIPLEANVGTYDIPIPNNYWTAGIIKASIGGTNLISKSDDQLQAMYGANWRELKGSTGYITQDDQTSVILALAPETVDADYPLKLLVALTPLPEATSVDDKVYKMWAEVISMGARARLHDIPRQPFTDTNAAQRFRAWFDSGCSDAKIAIDRGLGRAVLTVRPLPI